MRKLLLVFLLGLTACQNAGELAALANGGLGQTATTEFRPGNPKDRLALTAPGEAALRLGTDVDASFRDANVACAGSQFSAYFRFKRVAEETLGEVSLSVSANENLAIALYQIPKETELFDFLELEPLVEQLRARYPAAGEEFRIRVTQKTRKGATAEAPIEPKVIWQSEELVFAFSEPKFSFVFKELEPVKSGRVSSLTLKNVKISPQRAFNFTPVYACLVQPERRLALKVRGVSKTSNAVSLTRYLPMKQREILLGAREYTLNFLLRDRDFETFAPRNLRVMLIQNILSKNDSKEVVVTEEFGVDL